MPTTKNVHIAMVGSFYDGIEISSIFIVRIHSGGGGFLDYDFDRDYITVVVMDSKH